MDIYIIDASSRMSLKFKSIFFNELEFIAPSTNAINIRKPVFRKMLVHFIRSLELSSLYKTP